MALQGRTTQAKASGSAIVLGPPIADRASLDFEPGKGAVEFFFLTDAANRAWATINARLATGVGAVFWIGGPAGVGKTHFLNYLMALEERAATETGRRAIIMVALESRAAANNLEQQIFEQLARKIGAPDAAANLWRRLHGGEALSLAMEQASRVGMRSIVLGIDFGAADATSYEGYFAQVARAAASSRHLVFHVYVAARSPASTGSVALEIAPAGDKELLITALARARQVVEQSAASAFYESNQSGEFHPCDIYPFHPGSIETIRALAGKAANVAALAKIFRAVLDASSEIFREGLRRPLIPVELMRVTAVARLVEEHIGDAARSALRNAYHAADTMEDRGCAHAIVDALMLEWITVGPRAIAPEQLRARLPETYRRHGHLTPPVATIAVMLRVLSSRTGEVIAFDGRRASFNPDAASAAELAAFNNALQLLRRFDASLGPAAEVSELHRGLKRVGHSMARAAEAANRAGIALSAACRDLRTDLLPEHLRILDDFVALAAAGPAALFRQAADPDARARTEHVIAAYETLAAKIAAAPRVREMREYLRATSITPDLKRDDTNDGEPFNKPIAAAQIDCQLLLAALESEPLLWEQRGLDALEIRFQKFKWNYIQLYKDAHERNRRDSEVLASELAEAREHFAALQRLNSISALGAPIGAATGVRIEELGRRLVRCAAEVPLTLDLVPRCARCGYVLGSILPRTELHEAFDEVRRAIKARLAALSQRAIAHLIRLHDRDHRLDGFLKITQASHTDALVRVLDENLATYLGRLLEDVRDEAQAAPSSVVQPFVRSERKRVERNKRARTSVRRRTD